MQRMRGRGALKDRQREAERNEGNCSGRPQRPKASRVWGGVGAPAPRGPQPPAASGMKLPACRAEPPPPPSATPGGGESGLGSGRRQKVPRPAVLPPHLQRPASALRAPRRPPRRLHRRPCRVRLGALRGTWRRPPGTSGLPGGLDPEEGEREKETETCCRGQGSREEGTAVHARNSACDPARQAPAGRTECGARGTRAHLEPAPLLSLFPGSSRSRLRPRPAPGRRPHSAAAGSRAPRAPRPRRRRRPSRAPSTLSPRQSRRRRPATRPGPRLLPSQPAPPAPPPRGPAPSRSPSPEASHWAGIIYVTSNPSPPPSRSRSRASPGWGGAHRARSSCSWSRCSGEGPSPAILGRHSPPEPPRDGSAPPRPPCDPWLPGAPCAKAGLHSPG